MATVSVDTTAAAIARAIQGVGDHVACGLRQPVPHQLDGDEVRAARRELSGAVVTCVHCGWGVYVPSGHPPYWHNWPMETAISVGTAFLAAERASRRVW